MIQEPKKQEITRAGPRTVRVWACCGVFGYQIPWPIWHTMGIYAQPPNDTLYPYIYLYSNLGQLNQDVEMRNAGPSAASKRILAQVNIDHFVDMDSKMVDWGAIANKVISLWPEPVEDEFSYKCNFVGPSGQKGTQHET